MNNTKVYVIIVNYNAVEDTLECLETLFKQKFKNFQTIIVDNSTQKDTVEKINSWAKGEWNHTIKTNYPELVFPQCNKPVSCKVVSEDTFKTSSLSSEDLIIVKTEENNGFAAGNNIALNYIKNDSQNYLCWLLNNDTVLSRNALDRIVDYFNNNKNCNYLGTSLMEYYFRGEVQAIGGLFNSTTSKLNLPKNKEDFYNSNSIKYPNGASMIISREFLNNVGIMSEDYFLYFEELDWVLRGKALGYNTSFLQDELVYHKGGVSTGKNSELADYYFLRGKYIVTLKFFKKFFLFIFLMSIIAFPINRIIRGQTSRIKILFMVIRDVYSWRIKSKPLKRFS